MGAPFPRWTNTGVRLGLVAGAGALLGVPALLMGYVRTPYVTQEGVPVDQPVQFDHRHHVRDDGIDCRYCHYSVESTTTAGMPPTELCMNCHSQIWVDSPLLEPVRRSAFEGKPLRWKRVHDLPDFVYFNHAAHVSKGVGCVSCHGRVDLMPAVAQAAPLTMGWCLDCHRNPAPHLRPLDRITDMTFPPVTAASARGDVAAPPPAVNPPTYCSGCHR